MAILGKNPYGIIVAELKVHEMDKGKMSDMEIKRRLADILAEGILQNSLTEFTRMHDKMDWGDVYRARCYLAPSGDVKILRQAFTK